MLDKYGDGYELEILLNTRQNALCKDPRNKIYCFIGLANDVYGRLPKYYGKSLFGVRKDIVEFKNEDHQAPQYDILQFVRFCPMSARRTRHSNCRQTHQVTNDAFNS